MALSDFLYSDEMIFEGEQAEAYKKKKAAMKAQSKQDDEDYLTQRWNRTPATGNTKQTQKFARDVGHDRIGYGSNGAKSNKPEYTEKSPGSRMTQQNPNNSWKHPVKRAAGKNEDQKRKDKVRDMMSTKVGKNHYVDKYYGSDADSHRAEDAANRHIRRHPEQYKESVELYDGAITLV